MIYYTADWRFGHANIIKYSARPFANIWRMNEALIENYNSVVADTDTVYVLGDVSFLKFGDTEPMLRRLKGTKHLILGNHDKHLRHRPGAKEYFASVNDIIEILDGGCRVVLRHSPMLSWEGMTAGALHVFGHIHNNAHDPQFLLLENLNAYNAGVDVNGYRPATLEQLISNKRKFYTGFYNEYDPGSETGGSEADGGAEM